MRQYLACLRTRVAFAVLHRADAFCCHNPAFARAFVRLASSKSEGANKRPRSDAGVNAMRWRTDWEDTVRPKPGAVTRGWPAAHP